MRVAIAFFGITRSLKYTIESINKNILDIFHNNKIKYDIFMHTYELSVYSNSRTGENTTNIDNNEYKLLQPTYIQVENQDKVKKNIDMLQYRTHPDPWRTHIPYNSVDNFILAQYSKSKCVHMIDHTGIHYDYILFMRPDCMYIEPFCLDFLKSVNNTTICIPKYHLYGTYRINDRFAITNMFTYKNYGNVFNKLLDISKLQPLHSETVLGEILHNDKITIVRIPFKFSRIRCNGYVVDTF